MLGPVVSACCACCRGCARLHASTNPRATHRSTLLSAGLPRQRVPPGTLPKRVWRGHAHAERVCGAQPQRGGDLQGAMSCPDAAPAAGCWLFCHTFRACAFSNGSNAACLTATLLLRCWAPTGSSTRAWRTWWRAARSSTRRSPSSTTPASPVRESAGGRGREAAAGGQGRRGGQGRPAFSGRTTCRAPSQHQPTAPPDLTGTPATPDDAPTCARRTVCDRRHQRSLSSEP